MARHPTATRIVESSLALFADRGVDGTPIVEIERAAGLAAGSGAFYRHFRSKTEVLAAAMEDAVEIVDAGLDVFAALEPESLAEEIRMIAFGSFQTWDLMRDLLLVSLREARNYPEVFGASEANWNRRGHQWFSSWLSEKHAQGIFRVDDPDAMSVLLMGALSMYWQLSQLLEDKPYGVTQERHVDLWVQTVLLVTHADDG